MSHRRPCRSGQPSARGSRNALIRARLDQQHGLRVPSGRTSSFPCPRGARPRAVLTRPPGSGPVGRGQTGVVDGPGVRVIQGSPGGSVARGRAGRVLSVSKYARRRGVCRARVTRENLPGR